MIKESEFRHQFISSRSIHLLADTVLSNVNELSDTSSDVLLCLLSSMKTNVYIPGKTAHTMKQRARIIQCGLILVLTHKLINTDDGILKESIKNACDIKELEWNVEAIEKVLSSKGNKVFEKIVLGMGSVRQRIMPDITQREKIMIKTYTWIKEYKNIESNQSGSSSEFRNNGAYNEKYIQSEVQLEKCFILSEYCFNEIIGSVES